MEMLRPPPTAQAKRFNNLDIQNIIQFVSVTVPQQSVDSIIKKSMKKKKNNNNSHPGNGYVHTCGHNTGRSWFGPLRMLCVELRFCRAEFSNLVSNIKY